jgi:hypothetical protein
MKMWSRFKMTKRRNKNRELRLDVRAKRGEVTDVRILARDDSGQWSPCDGDFAKEDIVVMRKFARTATAIAKEAAPRFDLKAIIRTANSMRPLKRKTKRAGALRLVQGGKGRNS